MRSIRGKISILTIAAVVVSIMAIGLASIYNIRSEEDDSARREMALICKDQQMTMDAYLNSIQQSVLTVSHLAEEDLAKGDVDLKEHLGMIDTVFHSIARNTNGVLTYYYRVAPEYSKEYQGYWYSQFESDDFVSATLTPIEEYDPNDVSHVGWYYIPKERGEPSWMEPYDNKNLGARMISYVAPIYQGKTFVGVIGMDFSYDTMVEQVKDTVIYDTGYAFLADAEGNIVYHPDEEIGTPLAAFSEELAKRGAEKKTGFAEYSRGGKDYRAAWTRLANGMSLYVTAPESEINRGWSQLIGEILATSIFLLIAVIIVTSLIVRRITNPLKNLTEAAREMERGNYDVQLEYKGNDEVGILTAAFRQLIEHLKDYISDLNSKAYYDALTSVRNKGACDIYMRKMQDLLLASDGYVADFAICMFDCNNLKLINDMYGHDRGDIYLKNSCRLICDVFQHSPVFRIGGDEFVSVLRGADFENREQLFREFEEKVTRIDEKTKEPWNCADIALGCAVYERGMDQTVEDVLHRADEEMYRRKKEMKVTRLGDPVIVREYAETGED